MNSDSKCIGSWLHNFQIVGQHPQGVLEMCSRCKKRVFFKVINGKIDNWKYIKYHNRQLLSPQHPLFKHEYGEKLKSKLYEQ